LRGGGGKKKEMRAGKSQRPKNIFILWGSGVLLPVEEGETESEGSGEQRSLD